jgi:hypothetical protein
VSQASSLAALRRRISDFCRQRVVTVLPPLDAERFAGFALALIDRRTPVPRRRSAPDWAAISQLSGVEVEHLKAVRSALEPGLDAIDRGLRMADVRPLELARPGRTAPVKRIEAPKVARERTPVAVGPGRKRSSQVVAPPFDPSDVPETFDEALEFHMRRHGDTAGDLLHAVLQPGDRFDFRSVNSWLQGRRLPRSVEALRVLRGAEQRYGLAAGYFARMLPVPGRSATGHRVDGIGRAEQRRLAWHLPDDFGHRPQVEQEEILQWVRTTVIAGTTDYRRYQAAAAKTPFGLRFPGLLISERNTEGAGLSPRAAALIAPPRLFEEMSRLVAFKTATLSPLGYRRSGVWGPETAAQRLEHFSLMFGALAARPDGPIRGHGASPDALTLALLVFPRIWDWYLSWRAARRGFYTQWEVDMLSIGVALSHRETGWIRQTPDLANALSPIAGLLSEADIEVARGDWAEACDRLHAFGLARMKEVQRVCKVHRDPFAPILPILEAESPVGEYRKIAHEIVRLEPDARRYPRAAAESARAYLMVRLGLHLGLRQKNLRQLLICPRGSRPRSERELEDLRRGELRWSVRDNGWEVLVPAVAFKNAHSAFFGQKPYRLVLPDLDGLYDRIDAWIDRHRAILIRNAVDPQTFFVKTVKLSSAEAAYNQTTFYEAWRLIIQRYGIYNPYTGRGAIEGLLPHGPHNVRDVLATHILKKTGSYEQASYAIQDTPDTVAAHYGRFLPQDKAALAAQILNQVWTDEPRLSRP